MRRKRDDVIDKSVNAIRNSVRRGLHLSPVMSFAINQARDPFLEKNVKLNFMLIPPVPTRLVINSKTSERFYKLCLKTPNDLSQVLQFL